MDIPGERTTAALLLRQLGRFDTVVMRFDQIEDAVLRGDADCGVLIHEGRFTYQSKGLTLLTDLGVLWEQRMRCPLPLAAIAIRRDLAHLASDIDAALKASVDTPLPIRCEPGVCRRTCAGDGSRRDAPAYPAVCNDYTRSLDEQAVCGCSTGANARAFPADRRFAPHLQPLDDRNRLH